MKTHRPITLKARLTAGILGGLLTFPAVVSAQQARLKPETLYDRARSYTLAVNPDNGQILPAPDYVEAARLYRQAADLGLARAQRSLGDLYRNGLGVQQNPQEAARWLRLAADKGDSEAQSVLGHMYAGGEGVARDEKEAVKWLRKAADKDEVTAQFTLGNMYAGGRGVKKDVSEGLKWYRKAADRGLALAQFALGLANEQGLAGGGRNRPEAIAWYTKAAAQGMDAAKDALLKLSIPPVPIPPDEAAAQMTTALNPVVPALARAARVQADVTMRIVIDRQGSVVEIEILSGHPLLDVAAVETVQTLRFKPFLKNGQPVEVETTFTVPYRF